MEIAMPDECSQFRDLIAQSLAGGLTPGERAAFDAHLVTCPECKKAFYDLQTLESDMTALFAATQPDAMFESRILNRLRLSSPKRIHPIVQKIAVGLAASIMLGGFGYVANSMLNNGTMPLWTMGSHPVGSAPILREISQGILAYGNDGKPSTATPEVMAGTLVVPTTQPEAVLRQERRKLGESTEDSHDRPGEWFYDAAPNFNVSQSNSPKAGELFGAGNFKGVETGRKMTAAGVSLGLSYAYKPNQTDTTVVVERERLAADRKSEAVAGLEKRSRQLTSEGRYNEALGVVDQILVLDRDNDYATGVRPLITDRQNSGSETNKRGLVETVEKAGRELAAGDILKYPDNWPDLSAARSTTPTTADDSVRASLGKPLPEVRLDNSQFADSLDMLRDVTGQNIWVNWKALEAAGITKEKVVSTRLRGVKAGEAIQQMLNEVGGDKLGYVVHDGVITVSTKDDLARQDAAGNAPPATQADQANGQTQTAVIRAKIIRNGDVEFEVDSFDSAAATTLKIVTEEGGYIGTTSSEKLPNGKVKGVLIVRVPPGNLDTLVLKLRGLGELKRQNLSANDVTKQYYDLSSELRAAHAMQERLLEIIKTGNAQVKDLLNVEKELATWRGKIEKLEGEIRYYDNLVSLSTLNISLTERDIRTAAAIREIETADAGIEVSDVEAARASAIQSIEEANGRIIEAELKKLDAGQFAAKVVADVPAENAGSVIDRLKQIGKMARLEISRKQTTPDNSSPQAGAKVERGDTHIVASFYNLANVAPRQTVTLQMASDDVAKTYAAILSQVEKANGRVVTSNLQQPRPDETSGTIQFELPSNVADQNLQQLQQAGLVLQMTVSENPDTANVTSAKRGFNLTLIGSRAIAPRQTLNLTTEASDVAQTSASVTTFVQSIGGRIVDTNQSAAAGGSSSASLRVEVPVAKLPELMGKIESSTKIRAQQSAVRTQIPEGPSARALVDLKIQSPDAIVSSENGFFPSLRRGLSTSVAGLLWSLQLIIIGVCLVAPWALLLWGGVKFWKRRRTATQ